MINFLKNVNTINGDCMNNNLLSNISLTTSLEDNITTFKQIFSDDFTFIAREFQNKYLPSVKFCIFYFKGMVDTEVLNEHVIEPILSENLMEDISLLNLVDELQNKVIMSSDITSSNDFQTILDSMIYGDTVLLVDGYDNALLINSKSWPSRAIDEPESAQVVRGPREGFVESILTNISLVRRRIKNPNLKFKCKELGVQTHTKICIAYIEGVADENILSELEKRLDQIEIDGILDSGYIQEFIKDAPYSPFETVGANERPDIVAGKLLEGRIAVFVDGSPFVLTVPYIMIEYFQANEDYYNNFLFASFNRIIRAASGLLSISIPGLYLAIAAYHQEMLPTSLLISISAARQNVPFPTVVSIFAMLTIFDIVREVGTRIPTPIGQAINIVGALVLGEAAADANLVSAPVIIITAFTGMTKLLNPNLLGAIIILRTLLLFASAFLGIYGFILGYLAIVLHMMSLRSFGVPYMLNTTRIKDQDGKDAWIRAPWWMMSLRPKLIGKKNLLRQPSKKAKRK